jgi:hypothetical protein
MDIIITPPAQKMLTLNIIRPSPPDIYGLEIDISQSVDIFDFATYSQEYNLMREHFAELELYLRTSILIDYKHNYLSERDRNIIEITLNTKTDPRVQRKFLREITNVLEPAYIMLHWYRHFVPDKLTSDPGVVARVLDRYQGNEDIAFSQMYKKRVDPNYRHKPIWFTVNRHWYDTHQ